MMSRSSTLAPLLTRPVTTLSLRSRQQLFSMQLRDISPEDMDFLGHSNLQLPVL